MPWYDSLLQQGYEPSEAVSDGPFDRIGQGLQTYQEKYASDMRKRQEFQAKQYDMYKVLRDAGYDPEKAHKAVSELNFPGEPGGRSDKERQAAADLKKTDAETRKIEKELQGFSDSDLKLWKQAEDEVFHSMGGSALGGLKASKDPEAYFGAIRKRFDQLRGEAGMAPTVKAPAAEEMVSVTSPSGKPGRIPKKNLEKALKAGYTLKNG